MANFLEFSAKCKKYGLSNEEIEIALSDISEIMDLTFEERMEILGGYKIDPA